MFTINQVIQFTKNLLIGTRVKLFLVGNQVHKLIQIVFYKLSR